MKSSKLNTKTLVQALALAGLVSANLPAHAITYELRAEAIPNMAMPDGSLVTMWGFALVSCTPATPAPGAPATACPATAVAGPATVPGPDLAVPDGDGTLNVVLTNALTDPVSIVIPGLGLPMVDGAAPQPVGIFTDLTGRQRVQSLVSEVAPAGSRTYSWTGVRPAATYLYHSGTRPQVQVQMGLYGAVLGQSATAYDHEVKLFYSEVDPVLHAAVAGGTYGTAAGPTSTIDYNPTHFLVNGQATTGPLAAGSPGQRTLVRFVNAGLRTHVPTALGQYLSLIGEDGHAYPYPRDQYSVTLPALKTVDALLTPTAMDTFLVQDRRLPPGGAMSATLQVGAVTTGPVATADAYTTLEDTPLAMAAPGVLINDSGDPLTRTATLVSGTSHGTVNLLVDGSFSYTPQTDYFGPDSFVYRLTDGAASSTATANITVQPANDAPVAVADVYNGFAGIPLNVAAAGVLANDSDVDGNALTAVLAGGPSGGTLMLNSDGSFSFNAATGGTYTFSYVANDGSLASSPATVTINMAAANRAPVPKADAVTITRNSTVIINVAANDTDPDGNLDPTSVVITTQPNRGGTVVNNHDGTVTYTPKLGFLGTDSFTYTIADTQGLVSTRRATVRVNVIR